MTITTRAIRTIVGECNDGWLGVPLDTGYSGDGCTHARDSYACSLYIPGRSAGDWFVTVGKETTAAVPVHLRLSWPAS